MFPRPRNKNEKKRGAAREARRGHLMELKVSLDSKLNSVYLGKYVVRYTLGLQLGTENKTDGGKERGTRVNRRETVRNRGKF